MPLIENDYRLANKNSPMSPEDIKCSLEDFEYYMSNFQQITAKDRSIQPFKLNAFQKKLFEVLLPAIKKETRIDKRKTLVVVKPRQCGCSVGLVAFINYLCSFVDGMERLCIAHVLPANDTITRFYQQKAEPIISGVHPSIYPEIYRQNMGSSILLRYDNIKGIKRDNSYELISSNASSIRSISLHCLIEDEVQFYTHPEELDSAIKPALPQDGFSLVVYLSTFDEKAKNNYFQKRIEEALDDPENQHVIFCPWFLIYPEKRTGLNVEDTVLRREDDIWYRDNVIIPAFIKEGLPKEKWGDCVAWYFQQKREVPNMTGEYPTTIDEVLAAGKNRCVFSESVIERQRKNQLNGDYYRILTDPITNRPELKLSNDPTPLKVYKLPVYGRKYKITIDPITSVSADSDLFAMSVWDDEKLEQVATFLSNELPLEDYADYAVALAKIWGDAMLIPESNVAAAFVTSVYAQRYYNFHYETPLARKNRTPGIRTTASSKDAMIDELIRLLENDRIILHDKETIDELSTFERKIKERSNGGVTVKLEARKGKRDDALATIWIYVGSLTQAQLSGNKKRTLSVL